MCIACHSCSDKCCLCLWQVGDLFRTRAFNFHARKAAPPRSLDTLTLRELYALKTETSNRALSAKMLADIYKRLESIHVQSTCRINTPLITQCLQSPLVSRNAQLAKHHSPAMNMEVTTKSGERLGGTLARSVGGKTSAKEKGSGMVLALCSGAIAAWWCIAAWCEPTITPLSWCCLITTVSLSECNAWYTISVMISDGHLHKDLLIPDFSDRCDRRCPVSNTCMGRCQWYGHR